jgi:hypothetical protein
LNRPVSPGRFMAVSWQSRGLRYVLAAKKASSCRVGELRSPAQRGRPLDEITGIGITAAQTIIAEVGLDMTQFRTAGHLASWAELSPRTIQSSTRHRNAKTGQGQPVPQASARRRCRVGGQDQYLPRRAPPAAGQTPRQTQSDRRGRPARSWSSSGTCSPTRPPASTSSAPTSTRAVNT